MGCQIPFCSDRLYPVRHFSRQLGDLVARMLTDEGNAGESLGQISALTDFKVQEIRGTDSPLHVDI